MWNGIVTLAKWLGIIAAAIVGLGALFVAWLVYDDWSKTHPDAKWIGVYFAVGYVFWQLDKIRSSLERIANSLDDARDEQHQRGRWSPDRWR